MENRAENTTTINEVSENIRPKKESTDNTATAISLEDILARIDMIIVQGNNLREAAMQIHSLPVNDSPEGGLDGAGRAKAIGNIYAARETTNQKMLDLLNRMYDDIAPKRTGDGVTSDAKELQKAKALEKLAGMSFAGVAPQTAEAILSFMNHSLM